MSWLPQDKLTTEEKEKLKVLQQRKDSLIGKYHTQIKSQTTTHETWLNTFITDNTKKRVQKCKDYHEKKIDKVELTLDDLQAYAIYSTAINTFKETKDKTTKQYNKDLETIELEIDELAKEINRQILTREQQQKKTDRTKEIQKLKAESEGILQDIRRIEKAVVVEDQFLNRKDIGLLDKALARRYQQKLVKHKRNLENRLNRRQQIIKEKGLPLDVTPDDELSDGGYSSIEEFKDRETLPQRYRIKRSRFRENYPSLFDYPNEISKHHTVDRLVTDEQEELNKRIVKQEQETRAKSKPKKEESGKQKPSQLSVVSDQQDPDLTPPQTPVKMPGNRDEERNHYWSLRDIPKFEGKGEQPFSHLMEFEDYLIASGVRMEPDEDENGRRIDVDYRDIINRFKASLKNNARVWYSMYIDGRITDLYSEAGWKTIKSRFLTYFNPIGSTKEQQIKAWKELKWKPEEEKLTDFVFRFSQLAHELAYTDEQQIAHFVLCIPRGLYLYLEGAKTVPDAFENLRKGIALGGLDTFNSVSTSKTTDDSKPSVPFMAVKEYRPKVTTEDTLRVVKESIQESVYENNRSMIKQLDKIGNKLANVVEHFQKKQSSRSSRNRDRSNSRDRDDSRDRYRNKNRSRNRSRDRSRDRSRNRRDSRNNSRDRRRSDSREGRSNQQRSGSGQRYFDKKDFCEYCNRTGHPAHRCFKLENYLKRQGKRIVLHDDDDVQEIAQAVQDLNTKLNSLKLSNSTNN